MLVLEDDGKGFDFSGRHTQSEMESSRRRALGIVNLLRLFGGGELSIESQPNQGAHFPGVC